MPLLTDNEPKPLDEAKHAKSGEEFGQVTAPISYEDYQALTFLPTSLRVLTFFNPAIKLGKDRGGFDLHKWQMEVNEDFSLGITRNYRTGEEISRRKPDSIHPYRFALCAANGSGKDNFVVAPISIWFILTKVKAKVIITSAAAKQLEIQTEKYIRELALDVNKWAVQNLGKEIIEVKQRNLRCILTDSFIHMFATDEAAKAEGHHPLAPGAEMLIIVNEAKSISAEIYEALNRCTGFTHWLDVSSPGQPAGDFYYHYQTWPNKRRISYFDCPHHSPDLFEEDRIKYGEHSAHFRSKWLALFTFTGGKYVVSQDKVISLVELNGMNKIRPLLQNEPIRIGIDIALSTMGDETVISVWKGNKQLGQKEFRVQDSTVLVVLMEQYLLKHVTKDHAFIFADDGGVGRAVIDQLNRKGWKINRILNNSVSKRKKLYKNRGAELWHKFGRLIEAQLLIFHNLGDDVLFSQIKSRKYKDNKTGNDILCLESKKEMMVQGMPSPDRADAAVLAFTDIPLERFLKEDETPIEEEVVITEDMRRANLAASISQLKHDMRYNKAKLYGAEERTSHSHFSLNVIMKDRQERQRVYDRIRVK